jgi:NAD(P)-dependent dehydrogenase (short-subunit alcohol dehydrogenase family)
MISVLLYILKYIVKAIIGLFNFGLTVFALLTFVTKLLQFVVGRKADNISDGSIRHVLVTGGSSGIGLEVARLYIIKGFKVTIVARNKQKLEEARHELARTLKDVFREPSVRVEDRIMAISCDVGSNEAEVQKAFQPAISKFGDVDILVNSAGTSIAGEFDELDSKEFERMLHINVLGSVYPTRVVVPAMKKNNMGRIVFVSSQVAQVIILKLFRSTLNDAI